MKNIGLTFLMVCICLAGQAQTSDYDEILRISKAYKSYMFRNSPDKKYLKTFEKETSDSFESEMAFFKESITSDNKILSDEYLTLPSTESLNKIYLIRQLHLNQIKETETTNKELYDQLVSNDIPRYELVDNYYNIIFTSVGNKNQPFNLSKYDFNLDTYELKDEVEKGIFFLKCMNLCGTNIWGYMNVVNPPNTEKALALIKLFPKINGRPYYEMSDLYFKDFDMVIDRDKGKESYKSYYLDKYFETLLSHVICIGEEGGEESDIRDILLGSILKSESLYKYTKLKSTLEQIFQKQERD